MLMTVGENDAEGQARLNALRRGLNQLGWAEGKNLAIEYRWAGGDIGRLRSYATELVGLAPDIIIANSTPALATLHAATTTIPVVFVMVVDPVGLGYIASLSHPGGNITGFTYMEVFADRKMAGSAQRDRASHHPHSLSFQPGHRALLQDFSKLV